MHWKRNKNRYALSIRTYLFHESMQKRSVAGTISESGQNTIRILSGAKQVRNRVYSSNSITGYPPGSVCVFTFHLIHISSLELGFLGRYGNPAQELLLCKRIENNRIWCTALGSGISACSIYRSWLGNLTFEKRVFRLLRLLEKPEKFSRSTSGLMGLGQGRSGVFLQINFVENSGNEMIILKMIRNLT